MSRATTRIAIAKPDIVSLFEECTQRIYTLSALRKIFSGNRSFWRLKEGETATSFVKWMVHSTKLVRHDFALPYRKEVRYTWGDVPLYELINSLKRESYFTHYTALSLHELTEQVPKILYLNNEQHQGSVSTGGLTQEGINRAFARPQRQSNNRVDYEGMTVCVVNGRNTGRLGVVKVQGVDTTDLERTLIDGAVRPVYCGGVAEVLAAYKAARDRVSVNRISAYLKRLSYIYPYHQAIGFYLERAGYNKSQLDLLRQFPIALDFYLANAMKQTDYDENWRLFYPKGF